MGSRALERSGHRVVAYDARGHGRSAPAPEPGGYGYEQLADDLAAVLDALELRARGARRRLDGRAHGAALRADAPERVAGARADHAGVRPRRAARRRRSSRAGTRSRAGCARAASRASCAPTTSPPCPTRWRETVETVLRQRLAAHEHPLAVADALEVVPRSRPFERLDELGAIARADGRRRQPRRGRPRPPARRRRALRRDDPRRASWSSRSRAAAALADRLAGRAALARDRRARRARADVARALSDARWHT